MSIVFTIGQGDTSPGLDFAIIPTSINLTNATATFRWRPVGTETWVNDEPATVYIPITTPTLRYAWKAGETDTPGLYEAQFVVTYTDSTVETFPNSEFITVSVTGLSADASARIGQVRFLVGDDSVLSNRDILFALDQTGNDTYAAAAICARALAAKYAVKVDSKFETVEAKYSQLRDNYLSLARQLDAQAKRFGSRGLGVPVAGGISKADVETTDSLTDRVRPYFRDGQFANPPAPNE